MSDIINRITGLLVIEAINSNPNGNPDQESDPRVRDNGLGEISPVSFKRKLRDLMELKEGPVCQSVIQNLEKPDEYEFNILESRGRDRAAISREMAGKEKTTKDFDQKSFLNSEFVKKYWDARLFGNTFLEDGANKGYIKTGIAQFGMGLSISPVIVQRHTNTNKAGVQEGKNQGMAPLAYRVVEHGVYAMPFFINPSLAKNSGCKPCDVELLKRLIPYAYDHTRSAIRPDVRIRHAWWIDHKNPLGSCPDYLLIDALMPKRKGDDPLVASESWADYDVPTGLPAELNSKVSCADLMQQG
ncbi:type I CRISPR-associated protein Cas7 [Desulfosarcina sp. OttesenSCG-928-A07]|nr:type I CRISPR-associated protein Cas7 [Desulfosarcina sp. OttesenSCG-928-G17]MDL2329585.1 type I CRISPR-associated protein Cas7 [Desulfosarcina sp. OttesenSCG-928-A07]